MGLVLLITKRKSERERKEKEERDDDIALIERARTHRQTRIRKSLSYAFPPADLFKKTYRRWKENRYEEIEGNSLSFSIYLAS